MILKLDRICIWIFIVCLALMSTVNYLGFLDEITSVLLAGVVVLDCVFNANNRKRYIPLAVLFSILFCYVIYSIAIGSNTLKYILMDFVIQFKSFMVFIIVYAIAPVITSFEKRVISVICLFNIVAMTLLMLMGNEFVETVVGHIAYCGITIFLNSIIFLFCNLDKDFNLTRYHKIIVVAALIAGLMCTRSKYYGEFIFFMFMLIIYKPGMMRNFNFVHIFSILVMLAIIALASWNKFSFYFITGNSDTFDPDVLESYARPVLYATGGLIILDYFPFGSGLASFATYASYSNYSDIYYEYGINRVWGLSPEMPDFICDAFYAELAQFGLLGIMLFIYFWYWVYQKFRPLTKNENFKYVFIVGAAALFFILVECTSSTFFIQTPGVIAMMVIGFVAAIAKEHIVAPIKKPYIIKI